MAFKSLTNYVIWKDSASEARNSHLLLEMITSMDVGRLENEQKELKLRNQSLQLENMAGELEQKRLEEEALQLNLKNKEVELQNAAVRLQNDSLDRHNKNLQISEYESKMAVQEQAARARRIFTTSAIAHPDPRLHSLAKESECTPVETHERPVAGGKHEPEDGLRPVGGDDDGQGAHGE